MAHIYYVIYRVFIGQIYSNVYIYIYVAVYAAPSPSSSPFSPPPRYRDVTKSSRLDQRYDHHILMQKRNYRRCFRIHFHCYIHRHLCCLGFSLCCMFRGIRGQAWIVKSLLPVCDKLMFQFRQPIILKCFGILKYHWSIWHQF